jgi:nitrate reductase cytochrome c-type subunit
LICGIDDVLDCYLNWLFRRGYFICYRRSSMNVLFRCLVMTGMTAALLMPVVSLADEAENYESDARSAEGMPPTIPHRIEDTANGESCLACHRTGLNGAPVSPHEERLTCTECHVPANPDAPPPKGKKTHKHKK